MSRPEPLGMPFTDTAAEGVAPTLTPVRAPTAADASVAVALPVSSWVADTEGQDS